MGRPHCSAAHMPALCSHVDRCPRPLSVHCSPPPQPSRAHTQLGTFRLPFGRGPRPAPFAQQRRPVVLLIHGISLDSTCWVVNDPSQSLAFILADAGWDVWMMNTRGNALSRSHVTMKDSQANFWKFSTVSHCLPACLPGLGLG